jgi:hypothetical protein
MKKPILFIEKSTKIYFVDVAQKSMNFAEEVGSASPGEGL